MSNSDLWEKEELINEIALQHNHFKETITALDQKTFDFSCEGKWTPGQQIEHVNPLYLLYDYRVLCSNISLERQIDLQGLMKRWLLDI